MAKGSNSGQAWRRAVAAIYAGKSAVRDDKTLNAQLDRADAIAKHIWATPARTLDDVMLRAELADYYGSELDMLDETGAFADLEVRAAQQSVKAVLDVLCGPPARSGGPRDGVPQSACCHAGRTKAGAVGRAAALR